MHGVDSTWAPPGGKPQNMHLVLHNPLPNDAFAWQPNSARLQLICINLRYKMAFAVLLYYICLGFICLLSVFFMISLCLSYFTFAFSLYSLICLLPIFSWHGICRKLFFLILFTLILPDHLGSTNLNFHIVFLMQMFLECSWNTSTLKASHSSVNKMLVPCSHPIGNGPCLINIFTLIDMLSCSYLVLWSLVLTCCTWPGLFDFFIEPKSPWSF